MAEFKGFRKDAFALLERYQNNRNGKNYNPNEFNPLIRNNFKEIVSTLYPSLKASLPGIDLSNFRSLSSHANRGNQLFSHFWGAFYRAKHAKKSNDVQLFFYIEPNQFKFGIYVGHGVSKTVHEYFLKQIDDEFSEFKKLISEVNFERPVQISIDDIHGKLIKPLTVEECRKSNPLVKENGVNIYFSYTSAETVQLGPDLMAKMLKGFRSILPIYQFLVDSSGSDYTEETVEDLIHEIEEQPVQLSDVMKGLFLDEELFKEMADTLRLKKNIVLQGPPGVGKTMLARRIAKFLGGTGANDRTEMLQFHQSYSYEDFIQGYRPKDSGGFERRDGIFFTFCKEAERNPNKSYFFIIDEINRGNVSRIFGEMLMLIDPDKRREEFAVPLTYARNRAERFFVPPNVHLIGTMNTADKSLTVIDYALRRRFVFFHLKSELASPKFRSFLIENGSEPAFADSLIERIVNLNKAITADAKLLGPGFEIGHSYFCGLVPGITPNEKWLQTIVRNEVGALLKEYWFENLTLAAQRIKSLEK